MRKKPADTPDDGRVIAPMNVEGMPWHTPKSVSTGGDSGSAGKLSFRENLAFSFGVLKAVMLVTGVFMGALLLFILFCVYVWLR